METKQKKKLFKGERTASTIIICICLVGFLLTVIFDLVPVISIILALLAATATFEVVRAVGNQSRILYAVACAVSAFSVLAYGFDIPLPPVSVLYSFYVLILMSLTVFINKKIVVKNAKGQDIYHRVCPIILKKIKQIL